jgi:hypothetical protein
MQAGIYIYSTTKKTICERKEYHLKMECSIMLARQARQVNRACTT